MEILPRRARAPLVVLAAAVAGVLSVGGQAMAGTGVIVDHSQVLSRSDVSTLTDAASRIGSDTVRVYTATGLANKPAAFDDRYAKKLDDADPATIIVGVNTRSQHVTVHGGTGSHLHRKQSAAAVAAFTGAMRANHGYAGAVLALLQSLQGSITGHVTPAGGAHAAATAGAHPTAAGAHAAAAHAGKRTGIGTGMIAVIAVIGVVAIVLAVSVISRGRRRGGRRGEWA